MSAQEHSTPGQTPSPTRRLTAALPFILTAVVAVLLSLGVQTLLAPRIAPAPAATIAPSNTIAPPTTAPTATTNASPVPPREGDAGVLRLEILDLEEQDRRLRSSIALLIAASQLDDAVAALQANDVAEADRTLLAARRSLDRAYGFSGEQAKGPIDSFRLQVSQIRDDLRLRPEGADRRLRQLRRLVLSLVDEQP